MRQRLALLLGFTTILSTSSIFLAQSPAAACSCAGPAPGASIDHLAGADAAFLGDVIAVRIEDPASVIQGEARFGNPELIFTFDVQEVYAGSVTRRQEISSVLGSSACGAGFELNRRYVVYAHRGLSSLSQDPSELGTGLCSGNYEPDGVNTFPLAGGSPPVTGGPMELPTPPPGEDHPRDEPKPTATALGVLAVLLLGSAAAAAVVALARRT